jgi:hypothetical protein
VQQYRELGNEYLVDKNFYHERIIPTSTGSSGSNGKKPRLEDNISLKGLKNIATKCAI